MSSRAICLIGVGRRATDATQFGAAAAQRGAAYQTADRPSYRSKRSPQWRERVGPRGGSTGREHRSGTRQRVIRGILDLADVRAEDLVRRQKSDGGDKEKKQTEASERVSR